MKVLFHIDEISKWTLLSANIKNILKEDPNLSVSVVANAEAVDLFITQLNLEKNVTYFVCNNALTNRKIDKTKLISIVQSANRCKATLL